MTKANETSHDTPQLSKAVKAKLKGCETPEDIMALAKEEGYELTDEELKAVTGGWGSICNGHCTDECWDEGHPRPSE